MKICIVGAGISGLATAQALLARRPDAELLVFESSQRIGGKVWTEMTPEGYLCEGGVNGFLSKEPKTLELCEQIGLAPVAADDAAKKRFVYSEQQLHKLPEKPPEFLTSHLLSVRGRLRVMYEMFVRGGGNPDETLAEFGTRRLGSEAFAKLIDPMASGVFAGNAEKLSVKSCFPRIKEVEAEYGSLIRGLIKLQMKARREGKKDTPGPGPAGTLTSFGGGMGEMTDTLASQLGSRIRTESPVASISRHAERFTLHLENGADEDTDFLILAVPAYAQARILNDMAPDIARLLSEIEYPPLSVVCTGYRCNTLDTQPEGFGFLVPSKEQRAILGTVVDSNVFPGRAPQDAVLLRSMVGGARSPQLALLPDDKLMDAVCGELKKILGIRTDPDFVRIYRHEKAIPQYNIGHAARLDAIEQAVGLYPGLVLTGNAFRGVSLNDCIVNAGKAAGHFSGD